MVDYFLGNTTEGVRLFWEQMGFGRSVEQAFEHIDRYGHPTVQKGFFGLNTMWDRGGDDNILLYGNGILNWIKLEP